jgi:hypothetical protein
MFQSIMSVILAIILCLGLAWIIQGNHFFLYKYWGPQYEDTRRDIFEHSKAYRQGMIQELENMQFEYERTADTNSKDALARIILHRSADIDPSIMPSELRRFIQSLRNG